MTNTNRNNLGIIFFALSSTASLPYTDAVNENNFDISHNYNFEKKHYLSSESEAANFDTTNTIDEIYTANDHEAALLCFADNLINKNKNLDSDFAEIVEKRFWDMI